MFKSEFSAGEGIPPFQNGFRLPRMIVPARGREQVSREVRDTFGEEVCNYLSSFLDLDSEGVEVLATTTLFNIQALAEDKTKAIVNLHKINDIRYINKFFEATNAKLPHNGFFIGCVETKDDRKQRLLRKFPKVIAKPLYGLDFVVRRVFPKCRSLKKVYFALTKGRNRTLSLAESLGRLVSCGFSIVDYQSSKGLLYFVVKKNGVPAFDMHPTYGIFCRLNRVGKDGRLIQVYKLRTMHPYSEYLQQYIFEKNGTRNGDKINNDFRVTNWSGVLRSFWLDELPMVMNLLKGDLKIVGVRPLSHHKFSTYPEALQEMRTRFKPGLVPPFYADMPDTMDEFFRSEETYLLAYAKAPIRTDIRYFCRAFWNILIKRARSS